MQAMKQPPERLPLCPGCTAAVDYAIIRLTIEVTPGADGYIMDTPQHGEPVIVLIPCKHDIGLDVTYKKEGTEYWQEALRQALEWISEQ